MRLIPFKTKPAVTATEVAKATGTNGPVTSAANYEIDLAERLKTPLHINVKEPAAEPETKAEQPAPETQNPAPKPEMKAELGGASATFEDEPKDGYEEFKDGIAQKLNQHVENPEELAETLIEIGNVGRIIWLPGLYENLMFPGVEKSDVRGVMDKVRENEKQNRAAEHELNNYEKRLYGKYLKLSEATENVSYTREQIKRLAVMLAKHIQDTSVAVWLAKYDWILYLAFLEISKARAIISSRSSDMFLSKFTGGNA